jgi:filamentous hemagglutinin
MHVAARRDAAMQFSWLNASENRAHPTWRRWVTGVLALVMFVGPLSITFEQSRDAAGLLAAGSRRISDDAWAQAWEVIRAPMSVSLRLAINEAQASPITDPTAPISFQPRITQSTGVGGGVPVVNITAPNAAGISLNQYQNFNIDPVGLILNNSLMSGTSLTGGDVQANPNLAGRTASVIVNQVTSSGAAFASVLNGPLEVFGAPATVIVANPNGVSTRGMGVTNTIGVTLSTGTPQFLSDVNGAPTDFAAARAIGYDVRGGHIQVEGNTGVNGPGAGIEGTVGTIDLIGETIGINAPLYAGTRINAIAGRQFVTPAAVGDAGTTYATSANGTVNTAGAINTANAQANNGLAIDATAYGAMTAGQIQVIGTAAGMGVRVNSQLASNVGDLTISANGDVSVAGTAAQGQASIQSGGNVALTGAHVGVHDYTIAANGDVGSAGTLQAGGKLAVTAGGQVSLANITSSGDTTIVAGAGATTGVVQSGGNLAITALGNSGAGTGSGTNGDVTLNGATTVNGATSINAARDVTVNAAGTSTTLQATAQRNVNVGASLQTSSDMALSATSGNVTTAANVKSGGDLAVSAGSSIQNGGQTTAQNNATLAAGQDIAITGSIASGAALNAQAQRNVSVAGSMLAGTDATVTAAEGVDVGGVFIAQNNATIHAGADVTSSGSLAVGQNAAIIAGHDVASTGKVLSNRLTVAADNTVLLTDVQAGGVTSITAGGQAGGGDVTFNGKAALLGGTSINAARDIVVNDSVAGGAGVALSAQRNVSIAQGGQVQAIGGLNVSTVSGSVASNGSIDSGAGIAVSSAQDIVLAGSTTAKGDVSLQAGRDVSTSGSIAGQAGANVIAARDVNLGGNTGFSNDVSLQAGNDVNASGTLQGNNVTLTAAHSTTLNNVQANGALSVASTGSGVPGGGDVTVNGTVNGLSSGAVTAAHDVIVNTAGAIQTAGALTVSAAHDTDVSGTVQSNGDLALSNQNGSLTSSGNIQSGANLTATAAQGVTLAAGSTTGALGNVSVTAQDVALGGSLVAQGNGTVSAGNALSGAGSAAFGLAATLTSGADTNLTGSVRAGTVSLSAGGSANVQDVQGGSTVALSATRDLQVNGALTGGAGVTLGAGGSVTLPGSVQAAGDLSVSASTGSIATSGVIGTSGAFAAVAGTDISLGGTTSAALSTSLTATRDVGVVGTLNGLADGTLSAGRDIGGAGSVSFATSASLNAGRDIAQSGLIQGQSVQAQAGNSASFNNVESTSTIDVHALGNAGGGDVAVSGALGAAGAVNLDSARDVDVTGKLASGSTINATAQRDINVNGAVESVSDLKLSALGSLNATGGLNSGGVLNATTGVDLTLGASTSAVGALTLNAGRDATLNGTTVGNAGATITAGRDLLGAGTQAITQDAILNAGRNVALSGALQANSVSATGGNDAALNNVTSATTLAITANGNAGTGDAAITGTATAPGLVTLTAARDALVSGALTGGQTVTLSGQRNTSITGAVQSVGDLGLAANTGNLSVTGAAVTNGALNASSGQDTTIAGQVSAAGSVAVQAGRDIALAGAGALAGQQSGTLSAARDVTGAGSAAFAQAATVIAGRDVALSGALQGATVAVTGGNNAQLGAVQAVSGNLSVSANGGQGGGDVTVLSNATALGNVALTSSRDTTVSGALNAGGTTVVDATRNASLASINSAADLTVSAHTGNVSAAALTTQTNLLASAAGTLSVAGATTVGGSATLASGGNTSLGTLGVQNAASLSAGGNLTAASIAAGQQATLTAGNTIGVAGAVATNGALAATAGGSLALGSAQAGTTLALTTNGHDTPGDITVAGSSVSGGATTITSVRDASIGGPITSLSTVNVSAGRNLGAGSLISSNSTTSLLAQTGNVSVAGAITSGGDLTARAGGAIGLNSALVNGNTALNAQSNIVVAGALFGLGAATINAGAQANLGALTFVRDINVTAGAGINTGGVQTVGNFQATANGDIGLGSTTAVGNLGATSYGGSVTFNGAATSGGNLTVSAANSVVAGSGLASAGSVNVNGANGNVVVNNVSANGDASLHAGQTLAMGGTSTVVGLVGLSGANVGLTGTLSGSKSVGISAAGTLDAGGATIVSTQNTTLSGANVTVGNVIAGGSLNATASNQLTLAGSQVAVVGNATLVSGNGFYNASQVLSGGALYVSAPNLTNAAGASLASTSTTTLNASNLVNAGLVNGSSTVVNVGGTLTNVGGSLMGLNALTINTGALNNQSGLIFAGNPNVPGGPTTGDLSLTINGGDGSMVNGGGQLLAQRNFALSAVNQTLDLSQQGTISQGGQLSITAAAISNSGTWNYGGQGASIYGVNGVTNTGTITGSSPLTISTQGVFTNAGQVIGSDVTVNGAISNVAGALLHADNNFTINGDTTNRGTVEAGNTLTVNGANYDNAGATTQSQRDININLGGTLQNTGGSIFAGNNIAIHAGAVVNDQTAPTGQQTTTQTVSDPALLLSGSLGTLTSSTLAGSLDHSHAVYSTSDAAISALLTSGQAAGTTVTLDQLSDGNWYVDGPSSQAAMQNGSLSRVAQKTIALPSVTQTVTTQTPGTSGVISAGNGIQITASSLSNRGGQIAAGGDISLNVASLSNGSVSPTVQTAGGERVDAAQYSAFLGALASLGTIAIGQSVNPNNDRYVAPTTFTINTGSGAPTAASSATWSSPTGMIAAGHDMNITGGSLVNAGLLYAGNNVNISGASVTNQGGNQQNSSTQTGCASGVPSSACGTGGQTRGGNPTTTTFGYNQNDATIYAGNNLVIAAGQINNTFGNLIAGHDLVIGGVGSSASSTTPAGSLNNTSGNIIAGNNITLNVAGAITNTLPPPVPVHENYGSNEQYSGCMTAGGYKESYCEGYVDQQSGSSSVISAGNNLNVNAGSLTNIGSLISAGNTATISVLGPVINEAQTLNAYWHSHWVQETGMFSADKRNDVWACGTVAECQTLYGSAYTGTGSIDPPTPVGNIAATIQAPNLSISSNGQIQNIGNIIGTSVSLTGATLVNGITSANTYTPRVNAPSQVISLSPVNLPGLNISTPRSVGGALPTPVVGQASYVDGQIAVSNGLGPQTLIDNLPASLQPSSTLFYYNPQEENLLLQQAALQQTGKASFVDGLSYDSQQGASVTDQEKAYLYGNAVAYAEANNLKLGDALSQTQISALDKPMLWYVEQTDPDPSCTAVGTATCPTITALMPQVYLPQNSSAMAAGGNIVGQDVTLNFNQGGQGSILNTGTISASGTLAINTSSLTNQANQVNVGDIWSSVKGGYVDTTGTVVQPGGFMSAANMDLNVQTLQQVGGALQKLNSDGTVDQAGTQQVLTQLQQQLGTSFTQTSVQDDLHTTFVKAGGMDPLMVIGMAVAVAVSVELGPEMFAFYNGLIDPIALAAISPTLAVLGSAAATGLAVGSTALVAGAASQLISTGGINLGQDLKGAAVSALTAGVTQGLLGSTGINNLGNGVTQASSGTTLANVGVTAQNVGAQALIGATSQTLINGGSFGQALIASAANDAAAVGANAIGSTFNGSSWALSTNNPAYVLAHGLLGCAAGAASGSGCGGGAIGGATSALLSPAVIGAIDPTGAPLTTEQTALVTALAMLAGGGVAGALGQNAIGAATSAENEALNNATQHVKGDLVSRVCGSIGSACSDATVQELTQAQAQLSGQAAANMEAAAPYAAGAAAGTLGVALAGPEILAGCAANPVLCANEAAIIGSEVLAGVNGMPGTGASVATGNIAEATNSGATAGSAADMTTAAQLRTQLSLQQAGILDSNGQLTAQAIKRSDAIPLADGVIKNPTVVSELTSDGSNIADWGKYTTQSATMPNGQSMQVHYYMNSVTGKVDYVTPDFKVKGVVKP